MLMHFMPMVDCISQDFARRKVHKAICTISNDRTVRSEAAIHPSIERHWQVLHLSALALGLLQPERFWGLKPRISLNMAGNPFLLNEPELARNLDTEFLYESWFKVADAGRILSRKH